MISTSTVPEETVSAQILSGVSDLTGVPVATAEATTCTCCFVRRFFQKDGIGGGASCSGPSHRGWVSPAGAAGGGVGPGRPRGTARATRAGYAVALPRRQYPGKLLGLTRKGRGGEPPPPGRISRTWTLKLNDDAQRKPTRPSSSSCSSSATSRNKSRSHVL